MKKRILERKYEKKEDKKEGKEEIKKESKKGLMKSHYDSDTSLYWEKRGLTHREIRRSDQSKHWLNLVKEKEGRTYGRTQPFIEMRRRI